MLTHANLLANIRAMGRATEVTSEDVFVSWLPLYHDMGLIGAWLGSLYHGCRLVIIPPLSFLARPERWLWAIHTHRGTLSASPNFGYDLCCRRLSDEVLAGLDLGSWRLAFNGAEPVSPETIAAFARRFTSFGFKPEAATPVYGLAECSVGLTFPPLGRGPLIDRVRRADLGEEGIATPADEDEAALQFVSCGRPLSGHQIRIVDEAGREIPDRRQGRLQFKGPSATSGYFRNPEKTQSLFQGDWLDTGDLAYSAQGEVYITGRVKISSFREDETSTPMSWRKLWGIFRGSVEAVWPSLRVRTRKPAPNISSSWPNRGKGRKRSSRNYALWSSTSRLTF